MARQDLENPQAPAKRGQDRDATPQGDADANDPRISIVIPLLNEQESLPELHRQLSRVLGGLGRPYEILFVNDGSNDQSAAIINRLCIEDEHVGAIHFRRNFGKAAALDAGFRHARGQVIITMDADLQDEPEEIPRFLEKLNDGFDLVSGWKQVRNDPLDKTLPSKVFNYLVGRVSGLRLNDFNCGFKAYRAETVRDLRLYGEMHRFVPVLVFWNGFRVAEITVQHHARRFGKSKYGFERMAKGFFDLMTVTLNTRYRARPLHLFGVSGMVLGAGGFFSLLYLTVLKLFFGQPIGTRPLLFLGLLLVMVGVQFVSTGLLGEMVVRTQQAGSPNYVIRTVRTPGEKTP